MKIVTYADIENKTQQAAVEDPQAFITDLRQSTPKYGFRYRILNIAEENGVELRDAMNRTLIEDGIGESLDFICVKAFVEEITKQYKELKTPLGFDFKKKEMCLVPPFEEFMNALRTLANKAAGRTVSDEEIYAAYDISRDDYFDIDCAIDFEKMYEDIIVNLVDEPDYSTDSAKYLQSAEIVGWDYTHETTVEKEYTYLANYDDLVNSWKKEVLDDLRESLSAFKSYGPLGVDFIFEDENELWDEITERYPVPSEETIEEKDLLDDEPDYDYD